MKFNGRQLAAFLSVSAPQITYWMRRGDLKGNVDRNPGRTGYVFEASEVLAFLDRYEARRVAKIEEWRRLIKAAAFLEGQGE